MAERMVGGKVKEQTLLRTMKDKKLWEAIIILPNELCVKGWQNGG